MGKMVKRCKRYIATDTFGFLIGFFIHGTDVQDCDGAVNVLELIRHLSSWLHHIFVDRGYAGPQWRGKLGANRAHQNGNKAISKK